MRMRWLAPALALAAACGIEVDYEGTRFTCELDRDCPPGFTCSAGQCASDGDPTPDASGCGAAGAFTDDFDDGVVDPRWDPRREGDVAIAEIGGGVLFELTAQAAGSASYATGCTYDLTDDEIFVRVDAVARGSSNATTFLRLSAPGDEVEIAHRSGSLHMTVITSSSTHSTSLGFRESDDRWWKIAGVGADLEFASSKDGTVWERLEAVPAPAGLGRVEVSFGVRGDAGASGARTARFDDYNGG